MGEAVGIADVARLVCVAAAPIEDLRCGLCISCKAAASGSQEELRSWKDALVRHLQQKRVEDEADRWEKLVRIVVDEAASAGCGGYAFLFDLCTNAASGTEENPWRALIGAIHRRLLEYLRFDGDEHARGTVSRVCSFLCFLYKCMGLHTSSDVRDARRELIQEALGVVLPRVTLPMHDIHRQPSQRLQMQVVQRLLEQEQDAAAAGQRGGTSGVWEILQQTIFAAPAPVGLAASASEACFAFLQLQQSRDTKMLPLFDASKRRIDQHKLVSHCRDHFGSLEGLNELASTVQALLQFVRQHDAASDKVRCPSVLASGKAIFAQTALHRTPLFVRLRVSDPKAARAASGTACSTLGEDDAAWHSWKRGLQLRTIVGTPLNDDEEIVFQLLELLAEALHICDDSDVSTLFYTAVLVSGSSARASSETDESAATSGSKGRDSSRARLERMWLELLLGPPAHHRSGVYLPRKVLLAFHLIACIERCADFVGSLEARRSIQALYRFYHSLSQLSSCSQSQQTIDEYAYALASVIRFLAR